MSDSQATNSIYLLQQWRPTSIVGIFELLRYSIFSLHLVDVMLS